MMKIAYLAPELPALSATFVYKEIFELEKLGTQVVSFSVHSPLGQFGDSRLKKLQRGVTTLYGSGIGQIVRSHWRMMRWFPKRYLASLKLLLADMWQMGLQRQTLGLLYRFVFAGVLADELLKHQCQHLHVHFAHIPTDIAMYAASLSQIGFSVTSHANDLFERGWLLKQKVDRATFFGTISEFNRRYLEDKGVDVSRVEIIRCGVDPHQFVTRPWKALSSPVQLGVVGRLVEKKGIDTLIHAIARLKQQGESVSLSIVGSGPLMSEMTALVEQLGLQEEVMLMGALPHTEVSQFIQTLDMFVLPCKKDKQGDMDGIPVVLMEAMMSGVPVVSTQISGIPELVVDGETGLCVPANDEAALSQAILKIIRDRTNTEMRIHDAIVHVTRYFSLSSNAEKLNTLFQSGLR